ncbi:MAG: TlpA family protein disulfide reductase [Bacteroidetes bacterium]|nr:MAG: TlpA family protein disulfide reductase [Bacteroidota bacterium]
MLRYFFILFLVIGYFPSRITFGKPMATEGSALAQKGRSSVIGQPNNVTIKGKTDSTYLFEAGTIYAYTYDDHISYREKELSKSLLDAKGNFSLNFSVSETTDIFLIVDNAKAEMVVEPDKTYNIIFSAKDSNAVNTLSSTNPVEIVFAYMGNDELNFLISDFSSRYETMLEDYRGNIARKESVIFKKIDTLETLFKKKYAAFNNLYLDNYIYYTFASLDENITLENKENVYKKHIAGRPILLNNPDYMAFFNQFYSVTASYFMSNSKMISEVNSKQNFSSIMEFFKQSKLLINDTIRETVMLKSLAEYFRYPEYKAAAVLAILDQAAKHCKTPENRKAAENLKRKLSVMVEGKPAPPISFKDMEGETVSLADLKGKYVYLNFWTTFCSPCTQDMTLIPGLKKTYGGKIVFVSISLDKKPEAVKNFLKKPPQLSPEQSGSGWIFLHADNYKKVKEEFNVLTVPAYYLIDSKGNVLRSPAPKPADIELELMNIKKKK